MKALLLATGLLSACAGLAQNATVPLADTKDSSEVKTIIYSPARPYNIRNNKKFGGGMPNAITLTPLLTQKVGNNLRGFDLYQLQQDGMICLVPDSTNTSHMPVVGFQQRARKEAPEVKIIH